MNVVVASKAKWLSAKVGRKYENYVPIQQANNMANRSIMMFGKQIDFEHSLEAVLPARRFI